MNMFKTMAVAAGIFTASFSQAQTADEIIAKNIEAMGGATKLAALTSVKQSASMSVQGLDIPMEFQIVHGKGYRMDVEVMGTSNYMVANPTAVSSFFPIQQMTEPKAEDAEGIEAAKNLYDLQGFYGYKEKGWEVSFDGKEKVDGAEMLKLKVVKAKKTSTYFLDASTYRVAKIVSMGKSMQGGEEKEMESTFSDYKQDKNGYWFAFSVQNGGMPAAMTFTSIESNVKIDESIFKQ
jgi:hypothetical protein